MTKKAGLFRALEQRLREEAFDDEYLELLASFMACERTEADAGIFYAAYALAMDSLETAREEAEKAYRLRHVNPALWRVLRDVYARLGDLPRSFLFAGYLASLYGEKVEMEVPKAESEAVLLALSMGMGCGEYAPIAGGRMHLTEAGLVKRMEMFAGEPLPSLTGSAGYPFWVGAYAEAGLKDYAGRLLASVKQDEGVAEAVGGGIVFDLMAAAEIPSGAPCRLEVPAGGALVPVAGTEEKQRIRFQEEDGSVAEDSLSKWCFSFYRLDHAATASSAGKLAIGKPVPIGHSPRRRKVVLNLFPDAFCWQAVKERGYDLVPNILRFFEKGVIFDDHHSVSEYTYPAYPGILTGLYPHHTQLIHEKQAHALAGRIHTLGGEASRLGYYVTSLLESGDVVYPGAMRGFSRILSSAYTTSMRDGVGRTIRQMEAMPDIDQFLWLHAEDTHPWRSAASLLPLSVQTAMPLGERSLLGEKEVTSVYLPKRPLYLRWNADAIRETDRELGELFRYLEEHYGEDEYLVTLFSDHGVPIYDGENFLLSNHQTGAAFMLRGAGVPERGLVGEMTSTVDIYPALASLLGFPAGDCDGQLPAALGGRGRGWAASMSLYPGIPYFLVIRTKEYEYRLETHEVTEEDGRVSMEGAARKLYRRATGEEVHDERMMDFFRPIEWELTRGIDDEGCHWAEMKEARPEWYDDPEKMKAGLHI